MKIAVIGAGAAGLAALRRCSALNDSGDEIEVICYEQTGQIGGTWVYVPEVGKDAHGLPIHSSMYDSLRTNLPKEVMGFPDFPVPENTKSYLSRTELLDFLKSYHDHFHLERFIKFYHHVEHVQPFKDGKWKLRVKDLARGEVFIDTFDAVMVCNGHYFEPNVPKIPGSRIFSGKQFHSHDYRVPEVFSGKKVVVVGAGPSGMDLAMEISKSADRVVLSHHLATPILTKFPENVVQKPDITELREHDAVFKDGSIEVAVDAIFYCTGYKYSFPFLDKSCGVRVDSNMVTPLWKHLLSIESPTLALVGLPFYVCAFSMFDLQIRFALRFWRGEKELPSKDEMLADEAAELERRRSQGLSKRQFHMMGHEQGRYYEELAETAEIVPLRPVLAALHNESSQRFLDDLTNYRNDRFKIVDDHNFLQF